jgi:hypothetical protein
MTLQELEFAQSWNDSCEQNDLDLFRRFWAGERITGAQADDGAVVLHRLFWRMDQRAGVLPIVTADNVRFVIHRLYKKGKERRAAAEREERWPFCLFSWTRTKMYATLILFMAKTMMPTSVRKFLRPRFTALTPVFRYLS